MVGASPATGQTFCAVLTPLPAGPGSALTGRCAANVYLPNLMLYLAPGPVLLLQQLAAVHSCSAVLASTGSGCSHVPWFLPSHMSSAIKQWRELLFYGFIKPCALPCSADLPVTGRLSAHRNRKGEVPVS